MTRSPSKHRCRMNRAREMCGRNVTTMTVRHPYCEAKRRSSRPSPFVVRGFGTKQCRSIRAGGAAQKSVTHTSPAPSGFDTTRVGAQPSKARSRPDVPAVTFPTKDEYRVGVPQRVDLGSHIHRQPTDHGGDHQNADRHHGSSEASPTARIIVRQRATLTSRCRPRRCGPASARRFHGSTDSSHGETGTASKMFTGKQWLCRRS